LLTPAITISKLCAIIMPISALAGGAAMVRAATMAAAAMADLINMGEFLRVAWSVRVAIMAGAA
jgi:hypothetical protein